MTEYKQRMRYVNSLRMCNKTLTQAFTHNRIHTLSTWSALSLSSYRADSFSEASHL